MVQQGVSANSSSTIRAIYDEYAGLLLGYIYEVVKDKDLAEQYLASVFNELPQHLPEVVQPGGNVYHRLQLLTRKTMADFFATLHVCKSPYNSSMYLPAKPNKFLSRMTEEQQLIFCSVHYHGKSISVLAAELNKPEEEIKKTLQQAFAAIRKPA